MQYLGYPFAAPPGYANPPYQPAPSTSLTQHHQPSHAAALAGRSASDAGPARKRARNSIGGVGTKGKGARTKRAESDDEDGESVATGAGDDADSKRKKRQPLSCGECRRRKISFDDEDASSPYALNSDVRAIGRRLAHLEQLFHQANPHLSSLSFNAASVGSPASVSNSSIHASPSVSSRPSISSHLPGPPSSLPPPASTNPSLPATNGHGEQSCDRQTTPSDTEDAVADLEEQTFGARVPVLRALTAAAQSNVKRYNYVKVPDMELTSCLTSILAEPLSFDQDGRPRSAVRLGLDLAVPTSELPAVRHDALAQIFAVLPDETIARFLLEKYFAEMEWDFRVLDPVAFPIEHTRYVEMLSSGRQDLIDPLWIAVFCMVLALSLEGFWSRPNGMKDLGLFRGLQEADLRDLPSVWHDAALRALQLGEWGGTPRIRTLQCCILLGQYIQISSSSGQQGRFLGWAASAFRVAQRMGLHRLGSDPQKMPLDDPALPPGCNSLKREMAVRLWHHLVNIDSWLSDSPCFRCYMLHPSQYNTAQPLNLNLSDLSRTDWRTPPPHPPTVYTDASFQLIQCRIAEQIRRALDTLVLSNDLFSYPAVLERDQAWRSVLKDVPPVFNDPPQIVDSPRIAYERACLHEDVFSRIVRLNRPLLGRGYLPGSPYHASTVKCVEAAQKLIENNYDMLELETSRWWMYTGTLASAIVLMMDKRHILNKARIIYDSQVATPALMVVVEEGRKILAALLAEEQNRRTTRAAHGMADAPLPPLETFAQVLKRVSRQVAAEERPPTAVATPFPHAASHAPFSQPASAPPLGHTTLSFAQAAASAMACAPMAFDPVGAEASPMNGFEAGPDFSSFLNTLASEDWTATTFTSPGGDEAGLLDQLAATW
ncbi:zn(2)-C6 fungal-type transcription factor [Rhodotorula toruloides]|uniref:Zn(2)-C6 fungal-type transcription factor n=1 Tax=Rhodotorula toruloides TaxID=5286 RepID=A0A511KR75_RHOTO|nr:zn(2)-C6 fungal-type transcription factor [Rhodotorula toruloides]